MANYTIGNIPIDNLLLDLQNPRNESVDSAEKALKVMIDEQEDKIINLSYSSKISLYNNDASYLLKELVPSLPKKTLCYLDPPYYVKGHDLYENHYSYDDHQRIATMVGREISRPWVISYDNVPQICELYMNHQSIVYSLNYSAADRYTGSEIMIFSSDLKIPNVESPTKIDKSMITLQNE